MSDPITPETGASKPGPSRRVFWAMAIVLALSLGVNAAILGFIAGRGHGGEPGKHALGDTVAFLPGDIRRAAQSMSDEDRQVLRQVFLEHRDDIREMRKAMKPLAANVRRALAADPYDPDALATAFSDFRNKGQEMSYFFQTMVQKTADNLSPAGRQALANARAGRFPGPGGQHHSKGMGERP